MERNPNQICVQLKKKTQSEGTTSKKIANYTYIVTTITKKKYRIRWNKIVCISKKIILSSNYHTPHKTNTRKICQKVFLYIHYFPIILNVKRLWYVIYSIQPINAWLNSIKRHFAGSHTHTYIQTHFISQELIGELWFSIESFHMSDIFIWTIFII